MEVFQSGNIADKSVSSLSKRVEYRGRKFCLHGFSVLIAGVDSKAYRKGAIRDTVLQVESECQPLPNTSFVDPHQINSRTERRELLRSLQEIDRDDFLAATAFAFIIDHMELLCCHDPVTGQKQLDAAVMQSTFELYETMCGGPCSVGTVSRTTFDRILQRAMNDHDFKVRENKTVSKCETCERQSIV